MALSVVKNADWVAGWAEDSGCHVYLRNRDIAFSDGEIVYIGDKFDPQGQPVATIDGRGYFVSPGFVNVHSHPAHEPIQKGFTEEVGSPGLYNSSLYEFLERLVGTASDTAAQTTMAAAEALRSGVTTLVDMSIIYPGWMDVIAASGLRAYIAPMFRSGNFYTANGHLVEYDWFEDEGFGAMQAALKLVDEAIAHPSGLLSGMIAPAHVDTGSDAMMKASFAAAEERGIPWTTHAAQSVSEFHEITRRHGVTPIRRLHDLGVLSDRSTIGHAIFLDDHPRTRWSTNDDLSMLADVGASVAHCPTVFMRRGIALRDAGRYLRAGVNLAIGTDTYPHNMVEEMRHVGYVARLMGESPRAITTGQIFHAATIGGARSLGRSDIGRLAKGCKADFFMVDLSHPMMNPGRDPIRSLVYSAAERAIAHVFVDGRQLVKDGRVLTLDLDAAALTLDAAQKRAEPQVSKRDRVAGRTGQQMSPLSLLMK